MWHNSCQIHSIIIRVVRSVWLHNYYFDRCRRFELVMKVTKFHQVILWRIFDFPILRSWQLNYHPAPSVTPFLFQRNLPSFSLKAFVGYTDKTVIKIDLEYFESRSNLMKSELSKWHSNCKVFTLNCSHKIVSECKPH